MATPFPLSPTPSYYYDADWQSAGKKRNGVHYVGDPVEITLVGQQVVGGPRTADFETGVLGATLSSADKGSLYRFDSVAGAPVYDNAHEYGNLAMKCAASGQYMQWSYAPSIGEEYIRFYAYFTGYPTAVGGGIANLWNSQVSGISMLTNGKLRINDSATPAPSSDTTANPIPLNQWVRIEAHLIYKNNGTGTFDFKVFHDADSLVVTEQLTHTNWYTSFTGNLNSLFRVGLVQGTWPSPAWFDNVGGLGTDWWGLYVAPTSDTFSYEIRDYHGDVMSTGTFDLPGAVDSFVPDPPAGGWLPGWYRCYITGPQTDAVFGPSYGATNFCVIRPDPHFVPMPAAPTTGGGAFEPMDLVMKGVLGIGTTRLGIADVSNPSAPAGSLAACAASADICNTYYANPGAPYADPVRDRPMWAYTPTRSVDWLLVADTPHVSGKSWARVYCKDGVIDGSQVFVQVSAGTLPSTDKVRVFSPDAVTLVETFDNLTSATAAKTAINGVSAYIHLYPDFGGAHAVAVGPTAIGRAYRDGIVTIVTSLFSHGVEWYEGPSNEPNLAVYGEEVAHQMMLYQTWVHDGDPDAKAMGPSPVNINVDAVEPFFAAGGGGYCDGVAVHAYNAITNGDLNLGRHKIRAFKAMLASYGLENVPVWQTESTGVFNSVYGVYHPRRARVQLMMTLLFEQEGVPKERNNPWYDVSHGFWSFPAFLENIDGSLNPQAVLARVLAEETWGKTFTAPVAFGTPGDNVFIGNVYSGAAGSVVALMSTSFIEDAQVTLTVTGTAGPVTVVDGFGFESTYALVNGRVTVPLTDVPSYVRLPTGASASVYSCNDWVPGPLTNVAPLASTKQIGGVTADLLADDAFMTNYNYMPNAGMVFSGDPPPDTVELVWDERQMVDRVIIWGGPAWQAMPCLVNFDVQTSPDGVEWSVAASVVKDTPSSFVFGTDVGNAGCQRETYWDEQWVFDVPFGQREVRGVRIRINELSFGGEPDAAALDAGWGGQGIADPTMAVQEIAVFGDSGGGSDNGGGESEGPGMGPCTAWINGDDIADCCSVETSSGVIFDAAAGMATDLLFSLSGRLFAGECGPRTVRPPCDSCWCGYQILSRGHIVGPQALGYPLDSLCDSCLTACDPSMVKLAGYPIREVSEVLINGDVLAADEYALHNDRYLVRLNSTRWPISQNLTLPDTEEHTWSVTYTYGADPPALAIAAAAQLGCELYKACSSGAGDCILPTGVTRITRQGITIDRLAFTSWSYREGRWATGLALVDAFLASANPSGLMRRPVLWAPGHRQYAQKWG